MPNTKITKTRISEHLQYSKRVYIFGIILALLGAGLLFDVTRHTPSGAALIQIALVDSYCDTEKLSDDLPALLAKAQERDAAVEEVDFLSVAYSGDSSDDYYGAQVYMVQLYAGDNDLWIQNEALTKQVVSSGAAVPLEELDGFEDFVKAHPDVEVLWLDDPEYTTSGDGDETGEAGATETTDVPQHAYAIDVSSLLGFNDRGAYDIRDKYILMYSTAQNQDEVFGTLCDLFDQFTETDDAETSSEETVSEESNG